MTDPWTIGLLGAASGALASITGWGAGLALPLLAWLGTPLAAALLSIKLGFALIDTVAWVAARRATQFAAVPGGPLPSLPGRAAAQTVAGGAAGALGVLVAPAGAELAAPLAGLLLAILAGRPWRGGRQAKAAVLARAGLSLYIGGCGIGAGLLTRRLLTRPLLSRSLPSNSLPSNSLPSSSLPSSSLLSSSRMSRRPRHDPRAQANEAPLPTDALAHCALANLGAAAALLLALPLDPAGIDARFALLACSQAAGAGLVTAWRTRRPGAGPVPPLAWLRRPAP